MQIKLTIYKKGQGPFCQFDADRNGRISFEVTGEEYAAAIKLNLLQANKPYEMTIDVPELDDDLGIKRERGKNAENKI